jgi:predicted Kef-type K+ transport protein
VSWFIISRSINQSTKTAASVKQCQYQLIIERLNLSKVAAVSWFIIIGRSINPFTQQQHQLNRAYISWLLNLSTAVSWFVIIIDRSINQFTKIAAAVKQCKYHLIIEPQRSKQLSLFVIINRSINQSTKIAAAVK